MGPAEAPVLLKHLKKEKAILPLSWEGTMQRLNSRKGGRAVNPNLT